MDKKLEYEEPTLELRERLEEIAEGRSQVVSGLRVS